jgi:N-methylhydantoinase A
MKDVGIGRCLVPYYPGVLCALGSAAADVRHDFVRTVMRNLDEIDFPAFRSTIKTTAEEGVALIRSESIPVDEVEVLLEADMAYEGQRHNIRVVLPANLTPETVAAKFAEAYAREYGKALDGLAIRLTTLRITVVGVRPKLDVGTWVSVGGSLDDARTSRRKVFFDDRYYDTPIYARRKLASGTVFDGPAIVEQEDTTTVIEPGITARVDRLGNLILEMQQS